MPRARPGEDRAWYAFGQPVRREKRGREKRLLASRNWTRESILPSDRQPVLPVCPCWLVCFALPPLLCPCFQELSSGSFSLSSDHSFLFSSDIFQGKKPSSAAACPPALAQACRYASSHTRGLIFHKHNV
jgi:hypothetical protein